MSEVLENGLTVFENAVVKKTEQNTRTQRRQRDKALSKIKELQFEIDRLNEMIDIWEAPVRKITGGFSSEEVLNGTMEAKQAQLVAESNLSEDQVEVDDDAEVDMRESNNIPQIID